MAEEKFLILSIDGGGIRGVYPAHILNYIQSKLGINLYEHFDLFAGTSTGSIIAAAVASQISPSDIITMYEEHGQEIFKKRKFSTARPILNSYYESNYLSSTLTNVFKETKLGDLEKPLILPATDVANGGVHVFKSKYSPEFVRDGDVLLGDAVLASCSAPVFFDPHKVDEYLLADGGLWANNPSLVAVIDANKKLGIPLENIKIVSIGTGHSKKAYGTAERKWGLMNGWEHKELINFILSLQSQSTENYLKLLLKPEQVLRINFESDSDLPLDDVSCINDLKARAGKDFTYKSKDIAEFLNKEV